MSCLKNGFGLKLRWRQQLELPEKRGVRGEGRVNIQFTILALVFVKNFILSFNIHINDPKLIYNLY